MSAIEDARLAWGDDLPDWVAALARAADRDGLKAAAGRCGIGASTAHEVIRRRYRGVIANQELAVRAALMRAVVDCPVVGEISGATCAANQRLPYASGSPIRVKLFGTCPRCPNNTAIGSRQSAVGGVE